MNKKIAEKTTNLLLSIQAISIRPYKPFRYTSGILSPIYIDNRLIISCPKVRKRIISFYIEIIRERIGLEKVELLSGTATAAIPHAAFISQKLNLPMVYVRDTKKGHGKKNQIEGVIKKGQKALIIEDHISTGGSLVGNAKAVRSAGGKVKYAIGTTTYLMAKAEENFKKEKIKVLTLTDFKKIIDVAVKKKLIKKEDRNLVLAWAKDPKNWGKKFGFE